MCILDAAFNFIKARKGHDYMLLPSIGFPGNCNEAISYYKEVLGAEVKEIIYSDHDPDSGMDLQPNFVAYSEVLICGIPIMMVDGMETPMSCEHFWFTLSLDSKEEATSIFNKLAEGGQVLEPLAPQFFASLNGSVRDRFGIIWNIGTKE